MEPLRTPWLQPGRGFESRRFRKSHCKSGSLCKRSAPGQGPGVLRRSAAVWSDTRRRRSTTRGGSTVSTSSSRWKRATSGSRRASRSSRSGCGRARATPRFRPLRIRPRRRRARGSRARGAGPVVSPGTKAGAERCFRSSGSMRSSSTGQSGAGPARTASARTSGSTRRPCSAARFPTCRRSPSRSPSTGCIGSAAPPAPPRRAPSLPPSCQRAPSARACRLRWPRSRSETASPGAARSSSCATCSAASSRRVRRTRS